MAEMVNVQPTDPIEADWGNAIRDRTVQRYDDAATRASENSSPTDGDLAFMEDSGAILRYFGGWKEIIPPGVILPYGGATAPGGFILAQGQAVSRTTYDALFNVLGTTYGNGDGSTTFNLPDMRQRFPLGKAASGTGNTLGSKGGSINHTHSNPTTSSVGNHTHTVSGTTSSAGNHSHSMNLGGDVGQIGHSGTINRHPLIAGDRISSDGAHTHTWSDTSSGAGGHSHTQGNTGSNNPPYIVVNFIIKT